MTDELTDTGPDDARRARALAALGVLEAAGRTAGSSHLEGLRAARTDAGDGALPWRLGEGVPDELGSSAEPLAQAWQSFVSEASSPPRLSLELPGRGGAAHQELVATLADGTVGLGAASVARPGDGAAVVMARPLRFGVLVDSRLTEELGAGEPPGDLVRLSTLTEDPAEVDLLLLPRPPADIAGLLQDVPVRDAGCVLMFEDPRAPLDLAADFAWDACHSAPSRGVGIVPLNRKQAPDWLGLLLGRLAAGDALDVALWVARGRFGEPPFLVATDELAAARLAPA